MAPNRDDAFATQVVGIDLGTLTARVALISPAERMPHIVRNNFALEVTPAVVSFDEGRRFVGEEGVQKITSRPRQTVNLLKLLLHSDPVKNINYVVTADGVKVATSEGEHVYTAEQLLAMLFNTLMKYARKKAGASGAATPAKVVVTLPTCLGADAREKVVVALAITGLDRSKVVITSDNIAAAVCCRGNRYSALPNGEEEEPVPLAVVDVGHAHCSVTVANFSQKSIKIIGSSSRAVGSKCIDDFFIQKILDDVKAKHSQDLSDRPKALARIAKEAQRAKEVLSTVKSYKVSLEALTDTLDFFDSLSESDVPVGAKPLIEALKEASDEAIGQAKESGVSIGDLQYVEVIGGGWRTPCVQEMLKSVWGVSQLGAHLDPAQTVAQGAALLGVLHEPGQGDVEMQNAEEGAAEEAKEETPAESPSGSEPSSPMSKAEIAATHTVSMDWPAPPPASETTPDEAVVKMRETEARLQEIDDAHRKRTDAKNEFESYFLRMLSVAEEAGLSGEELETVRGKLNKADDWLQSEEGCDATAEEYEKRLSELKSSIDTDHPAIEKHLEAKRKEQEELDRKRAEEARIAAQTKEPKTDPQRMKAAQERKDQGVTLFKEEQYAEAITRFVQALAHLKEIYDVDTHREKRAELALSCHLNIASASIKLKKWSHAVKNCTQALEYSPDSAKAYFRRGQANRQMNNFKEAKEDLNKALELSGGDKAIKDELAKLANQEAAQKKKEKAMFSKMFA